MAVIPMQKVRLMVHEHDVDAALDVVQRAGALEFRETKLENTTAAELSFPHAQLLPRVQHAIQWLAPYAPEKSMWKTLREGSLTSLTEADVAKQLKDTDVVSSVVDDLERLQVEFAEVTEKAEVLQAKHDVLAEWSTLPIKLSELVTKRTQTFLIKGHQATDAHTIETELVAALNESDLSAVVTPASVQTAALTIANDDVSVTEAKKLIESVDGEIVLLPVGTETADIEVVAVAEQLAAVKSELALLHDQAEHFAITHYKKLQIASEILSWQRDRFAVTASAVATKYSVVFDGWLKAESRSAIEASFKEKGLAAVIAGAPLEEGEEPPVDVTNSKFVQPFEAVTRLYGMPGYKDLDPTAYLAGFFFLYFGLCLTDVGYGLALVIASSFILLFCKVKAATRSFAKLLLYIGFATVLVGALFGGYFGIAVDQLPAPLQAMQKFDPIGNPLPVFYLALSLGVFQVMVGMILKIYSDARNGQLMNGVLDQGPWLFTFGVGILYVLTAIGWVDVVSTDVIGKLGYLGAALIVLSSGRNGDGVIGKIISAAAGLYAGVGYFSDVLSYSRLLALGLATSALAFAVNLIASMLIDVPYIGFILSAIILFIGHMFTLAINTLGAFVHSARLQFVEFFGKFIAGTGKDFSPLTRSEDYVTINDD